MFQLKQDLRNNLYKFSWKFLIELIIDHVLTRKNRRSPTIQIIIYKFIKKFVTSKKFPEHNLLFIKHFIFVMKIVLDERRIKFDQTKIKGIPLIPQIADYDLNVNIPTEIHSLYLSIFTDDISKYLFSYVNK